MNYNEEVKTYLSKIVEENHMNAESELYGFLQGGIIFVMQGRGNIRLRFKTENAAVARRFYSLCKRLFAVSATVSRVLRNEFGEKHFYFSEIDDLEKCMEIIRYYDMIDFSDGIDIRHDISQNLLSDDPQTRAYLRGVFLSAGYIADPTKRYLAEFRFESYDYAQALCELLSKYDVSLTIRQKKSEFIAYSKKAEEISTMLALFGAFEHMLQMQDKMVMKEMKNKLQRAVNCDTANMNKTIEASIRQQSAIDKIMRTVGLSSLPEYLVETAQLRMEYPESSLNELALSVNPPISRSTLNKRLRKIVQIAEEL